MPGSKSTSYSKNKIPPLACCMAPMDMVAFGSAYLANPDLAERLLGNRPMNEPDRATFYGGGAEGYTDYPFLGD